MFDEEGIKGVKMFGSSGKGSFENNPHAVGAISRIRIARGVLQKFLLWKKGKSFRGVESSTLVEGKKKKNISARKFFASRGWSLFPEVGMELHKGGKLRAIRPKLCTCFHRHGKTVMTTQKGRPLMVGRGPAVVGNGRKGRMQMKGGKDHPSSSSDCLSDSYTSLWDLEGGRKGWDACDSLRKHAKSPSPVLETLGGWMLLQFLSFWRKLSTQSVRISGRFEGIFRWKYGRKGFDSTKSMYLERGTTWLTFRRRDNICPGEWEKRMAQWTPAYRRVRRCGEENGVHCVKGGADFERDHKTRGWWKDSRRAQHMKRGKFICVGSFKASREEKANWFFRRKLHRGDSKSNNTNFGGGKERKGERKKINHSLRQNGRRGRNGPKFSYSK